MPAHDLRLEIVPCNSPTHVSDLAQLSSRGVPMTHQHSSWTVNDAGTRRLWCRVLGRTGSLTTGFAVELISRRWLPWGQFGRIERLGRTLHEPLLGNLGQVLNLVTASIPSLLWLDVQVFDEVDCRRTRFCSSILETGGRPRSRNRSYSTTVAMPLHGDDQTFLSAISSRARRKIREFERRSETDVRPIEDPHYAGRMTQLYRDSFSRTGATAPRLPIESMFRDASDGSTSALLGAFWRGSSRPGDLMGFIWSRFHGDYASYDVAASDRSKVFGSIAPGYSLVYHIAGWARQLGAGWMDLGGVPTSRTRANPRLHGIHDFKRAFSSQEVALATEFQVLSRSWLAAPSHVISRMFRAG